MVESISLYNIPEYLYYRQLYSQSGSSLTFQGWLSSSKQDVLYKLIENYLETGDAYNGDDNVDTLNAKRSIRNGSMQLFQTEDEDTYFEIDWNSGTVKKYNKQQTCELLGYTGNVDDIDTLTFKDGKAVFTDYRFNNLEDGQDSESTALRSSVYGNKASFVSQEFDIDYVLNAIYMDPEDPQYAIAKEILDNLFDNAGSWLSKDEIAELTRLKKTYGDTSAEYNSYLKTLILDKFDDLNEWDPNHKHLEKTVGGLDAGSSADGESAEGTVPEYNFDRVLQNSGLTAGYYGDQWWTGSNHYDNSTSRQASQDDDRNYMEEQLTNFINQIIADLGDKCTEEIKDYLLKAKNITIQDDNLAQWVTKTPFFGDNHRYGTVSIKKMINTFKANFESICRNNGKSPQEAEAERAQKEKDLAAQKEAYKSLFNLNMSSTASEAGVKSSYQVINAQSANDFKDEAELKILNPLKNKIKTKYAGKIPSADLDAILDYAAEAALANPSSWATQDGDYRYTINSSKVIDAFKTALKTAINKKGYDF